MNARFLAAAALGLAVQPGAARACGGLFCNNATPVVQQGERILFALDGDATVMDVRITYGGPPQEFGWLLPVPRGVETSLGSEQAFQLLDGYAPIFNSVSEQLVECPNSPMDGGAKGGNFTGGTSVGIGGNNGGGVDVISRVPIGPYDRAILDTRSVEDLRTWLDTNGYQIPDNIDDKLRPYVDAGAVFVAIKLLPGADTGDLVPLSLRFPGTTPTIPIVPTSVAADPDMGIIVSMLGASRAIPVNYQHVRINQTALDWISPGANYMDVVAQAVDEAGGKAFTTDFAGALPAGTVNLPLVTEGGLIAARGVTNVAQLGAVSCNLSGGDPDVQRVLVDLVPLCANDDAGAAACPETVGCIGYSTARAEDPIDGAALAARLEEEVNAPRTRLNALFAAHPYLTRFYSTMSPDEMTEDPAFSFNPDLPEVSNTYTATVQLYQCTADGYIDQQNVRVITPDGDAFLVGPSAASKRIQRDRGLTVQRGDEPGARVIESLPMAGNPTIVKDNSADIAARNPLPVGNGGDAGNGANGGGGGCSCRAVGGTTPAGPSGGPMLALLALGAARLGRRRLRR